MAKTSTSIANPYWDEVKSLLTPSLSDVEPWSPEYIRRLDQQIHSWTHRDTYVRKYAWGIPDPASLAFVAEHLGAKAIEIGAGTGYWASLLAQSGVDILAYDDAPPDRIANYYFRPSHGDFAVTWYDVAIGDPAVLTEYIDRTLFLCWPPYAEDMAYRCLQSYQGKRLVFIGEGQGGCTGDDAFFEELGKHWEEVADHRIVQWYGINDYITVYDRREEL